MIAAAPSPALVEDLDRRCRDADAGAILDAALAAFHPELAFACSLGLEDVVLLDLVWRRRARPRIFLLDTGRLNQETYDTLAAVRDRYGMPIEVYFPRTESVQALVAAKGPNSFYQSLEDRKECCRIRKVEPLRRALAGAAAWITGIRADQGVTREGLRPFEWDAANGGLVKVNPLARWNLEQVWAYVREHQLPYNPLHDLGYPSIGCAPCTRAVAPGGDPRSGRWWWERPEHRECGLHPPVSGKAEP
ncbi:MAG: phosphoadenylyl-sulfate reductase [Holophaga sp.]|jgi:phosphoadenosine phosphosulfate reductase